MRQSGKLMRFTLMTILLGMFFLVVTGSSRARAAETPSVRANYAAFSGAFAPLWVAADRNLFTKYGLNVDIRYIAPATATQALIGKNLDIINPDLCEAGNRFASRSERQGIGRNRAGGHHRFRRAGLAPAGALGAG